MKSFLTLFFCLLLVGGFAQMAQPGTWIPNGRVRHIARGDGKVFLSGDFNWIGEYYAGTAPVLNTDLSHDSSYPSVPFPVEVAIPDDAGGWYTLTYGTFATIGHIKSDKTVETLPITFDTGGAYAIAKDGNILYVGGQFTSINGTARQYVAAIDLTNNTVTPWNPGTDGSVYTIKIFGSTVYLGGSFSIAGGLTRYKIAAVDAATGVTSSWNANVISSFGYVLDIVPTAGTVYFGGSFTNVAGAIPSRRNFAAVNSTTGALTTFNPRPTDVVRDLLLDGTTLYIAGQYTSIAGLSRYGLTSFDTGTETITSFTIDFDDTYSGPVSTMAIDGQKLFLGGDFLKVNNSDIAKLVVVDKTTGALEPTVKRNISDHVRSISIVGTKVLVGCYSLRGINGDFSNLQLAALDENTGQGIDWTPQIPATPPGWYIAQTHLQYQDNRLYYWQDLEDPMDGLRSSTVGALNPADGSVISSFDLSVLGVVSAWAFSANAIYLAGDFTEINGVARSGFAAVDKTTGAVLPFMVPFAPDFTEGDEINSIAVYNNVLYVAGRFVFTDGGITRTNLAAWNATSGAVMPWAPQVALPPFTGVNIGAVYNGRVYLMGGVVLRVDAITGAADDWTPDYYNSSSGAGNVNSLTIQGNYVYLAGLYSPGLTRVGIASGTRTPWQPSFEDAYFSEGEINTTAVSGTKLYVGGNYFYQRADGQQYFFAQFDLPLEVPNVPPLIAANTSAVPSDGIVSIDLTQLVSDPDNNLDLTTLSLLGGTTEKGAGATIDGMYTLILDYGGPFSGTDRITVEVCDLLEACSQQLLTIEVGGMDLVVYNAVSPNGDGKNDAFTLQNISTNNKVTIFNRWGSPVFEVSNYDNVNTVFRGIGNNGSELPTGTYYYTIEFTSGAPKRTGFISLKR